MKTIIGINGAAGRMGQRLVALATADSELAVGAALESPGHPRIGQDAGEVAGIGKLGVPVLAALTAGHNLHAMIDFSVPEGTAQILKTCLAHKLPLVIATTGHSAEQRNEIESAAHEIAV